MSHARTNAFPHEGDEMHPILSKRYASALIAGALVLFARCEPTPAFQHAPAAVPDQGTAAALISRRLLFGLPQRTDAALNDDGTRAGLTAPVRRAKTLWV